MIGCGCLSLIVLVVVVIGAIFFFVAKGLKSNAPYQDSIAAVTSSPDAIAALGEPIEPGFLLSGNISTNNGEGTVNFSIPVSGPKGKGTIRVEGSKPAGSPAWIYTTWQLEVEGAGNPILLSK